jgi:hypothetical protein
MSLLLPPSSSTARKLPTPILRDALAAACSIFWTNSAFSASTAFSAFFTPYVDAADSSTWLPDTFGLTTVGTIFCVTAACFAGFRLKLLKLLAFCFMEFANEPALRLLASVFRIVVYFFQGVLQIGVGHIC